MKTILAIVAMVLLSGAAWACDWCKLPEYQKLKIGDPQAWAQIKSGVSITAPDPTAWKKGSVYEEKGFHKVEKDRYIKVDDPTKHTDKDITKICEDQCSVKHSNSSITIYTQCEQECIRKHRQEDPWANSRYRLEKNEVTGRYRITEWIQSPKEGTPQGVVNEWKEQWNGWIVTNEKNNTGHYANKQEANEKLDYFRAKEQTDKAWRPIK